MKTTQSFLKLVIRYCSDSAKNAHPHTAVREMSDVDFAKWLQSTSKFVIELIPDIFWEDWKLPKPQPFCELFPTVNNCTTSIIQLCVWSCCEVFIKDEITNCMVYGSDNWRVSEKLTHLDWIRAFVESVNISVSHSRTKFIVSSEVEDNTRIVHPFQVELGCLPMAVKNSFSFFFIVTDFYPMSLIRRYEKHLNSPKPEMKQTQYTCVTEMEIFNVSQSKRNIEMSILLWYKDFVVRPLLHDILNLEVIRNIVVATDKIISRRKNIKKKNREPWRDTLDKDVQPLGERALCKLDIVNSDIHQQYQVILLANYCLILQFENINVRDFKLGDILIMKFLSKAKGRHNETTMKIVKKFVQHQPPLLNESFIKAVSDIHSPRSLGFPKDNVWAVHYEHFIPACRRMTAKTLSGENNAKDNQVPECNSPRLCKRRKKQKGSIIENYTGKKSR